MLKVVSLKQEWSHQQVVPGDATTFSTHCAHHDHGDVQSIGRILRAQICCPPSLIQDCSKNKAKWGNLFRESGGFCSSTEGRYGSPSPSGSDAYDDLNYLHREIDLLAEHLPRRPKVSQYHWGGGTPTYLHPDEMAALHERVSRHFEIDPNGEVAIEVDPRATTREHVDVLRRLGFNRVSMGVQDFDPEVQEAVHRNQTEDQTRDLYAYCREKRFHSVNLDLIYGLPKQNLEKFARTIRVVNDLRPDRIAL